jgi:transposase
MSCIEIITSVERRRKYSRSDKERLVLAAAEPGARVADVARAAGVDPSLLYRWRRAASVLPRLAAREEPVFIPVTVASAPAPAPEPPSASGITIEFGGGARLKIEGAPDAGTLANVIDALSKAERRR